VFEQFAQLFSVDRREIDDDPVVAQLALLGQAELGGLAVDDASAHLLGKGDAEHAVVAVVERGVDDATDAEADAAPHLCFVAARERRGDATHVVDGEHYFAGAPIRACCLAMPRSQRSRSLARRRSYSATSGCGRIRKVSARRPSITTRATSAGSSTP